MGSGSWFCMNNSQCASKFGPSRSVYGCFQKIEVLPKHPKMVIFSRKTNSCWGNPPFSETSI